MVPHTWQSPSSPPPQSPLTSQQPPISLLFTNLLFNPQSSPLSEESIFFHLIPLPPTFAFHAVFHTTRAHTASSFSFRWNPTPWRNNHLRRLVILRHTSPPMLATLWNKRHVTHPRRWERHSETKDKVVSTRDDALASVRLSWRSQSIFLKFLLWMITPW